MRTIRTLSITVVLCLAGLFSSAQLSIDNVSITDAICEDDGMAVVTASGGDTSQPYQYAIIAGPVTFPLQSSNSFSTLSPGTYTFEVRDNSGGVDTMDETVGGSYVAMSVGLNISPYTCENSMDGEIEVIVTNGLPTFEYALIAPSQEERPFQNSSLFQNLEAGDYTVQVRDGCGNIQTRLATVETWTDPIEEWATNAGAVKVCGSPETYDLTLYSGTLPIFEDDPLEFRIFDQATNSLLTTINHVSGTNPTVNLPAPTDPVQGYRIENFDPVCNRIKATINKGFLSTVLTPVITPIDGVCDKFDLELRTNSFTSLDLCDATTWTLTNTDTGTQTQSMVTNNHNPASTTYSYTFPNVDPGNYSACFTNCCGEQFCLPVTVTGLPKNLTGNKRAEWSCMNETTSYTVNPSNFSLPYDLYLESAPATITTAAGTFAVNFADETLLLTQNTGANNFHTFSNLGVGQYTFRVEDACGEIQRLTVDIVPADLYLYDYQFEVTPGCVNGNKVRIDATDNANGIWIPRVYLDGVQLNGSQIFFGSQSIEYANIGSGDLTVDIIVNDLGTPMYDTCPEIISFSQTIPPYEQPEVTTIAGYECTNGEIVITAEASKGVGPYTYELWKDGTMLASQAGDGVFPGTTPGVYEVRVVDDCMNSVSRNITTAPLGPPNLDPQPNCISSTEASSYVLETDEVLGAAYTWRDPSGTIISTDRIVTIDPFTPADEGIYTIEISFPSASACLVQSNSFNVTNSYCTTLPIELAYFTAEENSNNEVLIQWQTLSEENNALFEIERSSNGLSWAVIHSEAGAGNSSSAINYETLDRYPLPGKNFYRLKQTDYNGDYSYSDIELVEVEGQARILVQPNVLATNGIMHIVNGKGKIQAVNMYDMSGRRVANYDNVVSGTAISFELPTLETGMYLVVFTGLDFEVTEKVFVR